ncbi:phosphoribosylformylglycinamidine synthase-like [Penaeus japonicus]|uniref:phosphoribosylformylglycinamidine synthase-like n=1 Tax=Penaeus japonicus TaxID=27405 RepID=UPI001C71293F|nr:phosphoribosylformylglycinamidine synthase-like [Penaeus japonicus]
MVVKLKMPVVKLYRGAGQDGEATRVLLQRVQQTCPIVTGLQRETCFYIEAKERSSPSSSNDPESLLGKEGACRLWGILGDHWAKGLDLHQKTQLAMDAPTNQTIAEIGPRLSFTTAWSTNAVSICHAAGLPSVSRLERAHRYLFTTSEELTSEIRQKFPLFRINPGIPSPTGIFCTCIYNHRIDITPLLPSPLPPGLAFDGWDLEYYTEMFKTKVERNPTTVELFDLAQSNSEHSRHWFFKGEYLLEGEKLPLSLLDMVIATNTADTTHANNVIAFSDNSSGIKGWKSAVLVPSDSSRASEVKVEERLRHLIFTAETHNFPTGVAPFSGATTGTGGRIRDVQAAGRGGHVVAGTAGYCFGNLHIPGYKLPWEDEAEYPSNFATPLEVAIEASNGASDYGNKFGEPVIAGFARSFGMEVGSGAESERREWIKPIMFSGGIGTLDDAMISKKAPEKGHRVIKLGGPVYRIGVGGGAASSVQVQGDNAAARDLGAVQRGDAEMEQKLNRVIRGCLEMGARNPILAIHDQGAGGNANVLKELMEGAGGTIFTQAFTLGDPTLSTLEVWGAEYQESNAILAPPEGVPALARLAARERCPVDVVGVITGDDKVRLVEGPFDDAASKSSEIRHPVDLHLDWVLGKMPKKVFHWTKERTQPPPLDLGEGVGVREALERVLRLPAVASKRYLTNKVDRSVTGLVSQQQCVGPLHTPLADVAVIASSYFGKEGAATSIGEQPIKVLVDSRAGARLTVLEALANLAAAPVSHIKDIKCSANWMWAAKLPGEGWALYEACEAMCEVMKAVGVGVDGGKDSLSMAARISGQRVVKAPGDLVVSAYAPCTDVMKVLTPDLKSPGNEGKGALVWVRPAPAHARLAGSALAQVYGQVGRDCPDVDGHEISAFVEAFKVIQQLIQDGKILAIHDISDGGLVTCLLEMAIAGWGGLSVDVPPAPAPPPTSQDKAPPTLAALFSEEVGWVLEVEASEASSVVQRFQTAGVPGTCALGETADAGPQAKITIKVGGQETASLSVLEAARLWEETSYHLEGRQANPDCAKAEFEGMAARKRVSYHVPFSYRDFVMGPDAHAPYIPRVAVVREEGSNGDREMISALLQAGFRVDDVTMTDLVAGQAQLEGFRGVVFPGGFSYADVLGSAVGWAAAIRGGEGLRAALEAWRNRSTSFSLGVCNGCQLMALLGWLDPAGDEKERTTAPSVRLAHNTSGRFESRWSRVLVEESKSVLLTGMGGAKMGVWVAHGEGQFTYRTEEVLPQLESSGCVALRYLDDSDCVTEAYPLNPNGSRGGVAGVTSPCGRHLALMPHPERCVITWQWPHLAPPLVTKPGEQSRLTAPWAKLFQNAFDWCLENRE